MKPTIRRVVLHYVGVISFAACSEGLNVLPLCSAKRNEWRILLYQRVRTPFSLVRRGANTLPGSRLHVHLPDHLSEESVRQMSIHDLIEEIEKRGIPFGPTTPRRSLERLLLQYAEDGELYDASPSAPTAQVSVSGVEEAMADHHLKLSKPPVFPADSELSWSTSEILEQLNSRGIRYAPTAPRLELLRLLHQSLSEESDAMSDVPEDRGEVTRRRKRRMRRERLQQQQESPSVLGSLLSWPLPKIANKKVSRAIHKAKMLSRQANDFLFTDEDGIRDVAFEYVRHDDIATPMLKRVRNSKYDIKRADQRKPKQTPSDQNISRKTRGTTSKKSSASGERPQNNVESSTASQQTAASAHPSTQSRHVRRIPTNSSGKRIYSPYASSPVEYEGDFDRFGRFVADSADRILWGDYDLPIKVNATDHASQRHNNRRHWKDRLEERFDYFLGIHIDGSPYDRWTQKAKEEERRQGGFDTLSVAQGRKPKRRGTPRTKREDDRPLWKQDNLISLLFGQTSSGSSKLFDKMFSPQGSVLNIFKAVFTSGIIVTSYLCRWASCRNSLPQPIVVVGMTTALVCARPRYRLQIVAFTLVVMRAIGELLHGYIYSNEGWEDDEEDESHD